MANNEIKLKKVSTYAREQGISVQAVYKKIEKNKIKSVIIDNVKFVLLNEK
jgi:DNA invertase Pin-like site-specific DNA recombinase